MKKNFFMWVLTVVVAMIGVLIAIISFFKNKRFLWFFRNEKDIIPDKGESELEDLEVADCGNCDSENCGDCDKVKSEEPVSKEIDEFGLRGDSHIED